MSGHSLSKKQRCECYAIISLFSLQNMVYPIFFLKFPVPGMLLEDFTACLRFEIEGNDALYIMEEVACTRYILTEKKSRSK